MAIVRNSILGLVAACAVQGGLSAQTAQQLFDDAFRALMTGKKDEALTNLQGVLKLDMSREDAFTLWAATEKDKWHEMLLQKGELGKIAQHILSLARQGRIALSRDESAIAALASKATDADYETRTVATVELANKHGEFAVSALLGKLGNHDDEKGQIYAIMALRQIGRAATLPLIEAMASSNATLRRNISAVFNLTKDHRAIPALAAALKDGNEGVVTVARAALSSMGQQAGAEAVALYLAQSQDYLTGIGTQGADISDVVWSFKDNKLTFKDCNPAVYSFELAKKSAEKALSMDPSSDRATTLIARSYLGQVAAIDTAKIEDLSSVKDNLQMVAMAMGPKILGNALSDSLRDRQPFVAVAAIEALGQTEDKDSLGGSKLNVALDSRNKLVRYAAALALTKASRNNNVPNAEKVVSVLASAVTEKNVTRVAAVGFAEGSKALDDVVSQRSNVVLEESFKTIHNLVESVLTGVISPDVVVINSTLPDGIPMDVIGILKENDRTSHIKSIVAGAKDASVYDGKAQVIEAGFTGKELRGMVEASVKDVAPEAQRERAAKVAVAASNALAVLAENRVDVSGAIQSLAAQLTTPDTVAIPAANALGEAGTDINPLIAQFASDGSVGLKTACANAAGKILGRIHTITDAQFQAMKKVAADSSADAGLRTAITIALGKATLSPAQKLQLVNALSTAAVTGG